MTNEEDKNIFNLRITKADLFWICLACWAKFETCIKEAADAVVFGLENDALSKEAVRHGLSIAGKCISFQKRTQKQIERNIDLSTEEGITYKNLADKIETIMKEANFEGMIRQIKLNKEFWKRKKLADIKVEESKRTLQNWRKMKALGG